MTVPSTKGLMLQQVVDLIRGMLDSGFLSREELEVRLAKEDLAFFDGDKIVPSLWYPVAQNQRILNLYYMLTGQRDEVIVELGRDSARRVLRTPAYSKLFEAATQRGATGAGPLLVKLAELVLNYTKWTFRGESLDAFEIEVTEAADYSDHACHSAIGFIEVLGQELFGRPIHVSCERTTRDRVVFRNTGG